MIDIIILFGLGVICGFSKDNLVGLVAVALMGIVLCRKGE